MSAILTGKVTMLPAKMANMYQLDYTENKAYLLPIWTMHVIVLIRFYPNCSHHFKRCILIAYEYAVFSVYRGGGGGSEQRKVTPRNNGKLQTFIAFFWSHNWIDKANAGKLLHNPVAPQNNFKNVQTILSNYAMPQAVSLSKPHYINID